MLLYIHVQVVSDMYTCYIVHVYILDSLRIRVHVLCMHNLCRVLYIGKSQTKIVFKMLRWLKILLSLYVQFMLIIIKTYMYTYNLYPRPRSTLLLLFSFVTVD